MRYSILLLIPFLLVKPSFSQISYSIEPPVESWQRVTVSIGILDTIKYHNKPYKYYKVLGTGVIFYIKKKDTIVPMIVTAKHVLLDKNNKYIDTIRIRFSWENEKSVYNHLGYRIPIKSGNGINYLELPDSTVDLACVPLGFVIDTIEDKWDKGMVVPYNKFASDRDYYEGREVLALGYPGGAGMEYLTRGLVRRGIISWLPNKDIERRKFLIDCNVYPGNSGGPVFSFPAVGTLAYDTLLMEEKFYGIVVQRRFNYNEIFEIIDNKRQKKPEYLSPESLGVGVVEPAKNVLKLLRFAEDIINKF